MGTILYHGSEYLIENPQFGKGSLVAQRLRQRVLLH